MAAGPTTAWCSFNASKRSTREAPRQCDAPALQSGIELIFLKSEFWNLGTDSMDILLVDGVPLSPAGVTA